jgi:hypothetical protein
MAMNSIVASNPRLSGENEDQYWERLVTEFKNRDGVKFKFPKIYNYLKEKLKWKIYCNEVSSQDMKCKARPKGTKSAKQLESDKACVAHVIEDLTNEVLASSQPLAGNPNKHNELIKMIEGQSKLLYQFGLMLTSSTLSPARKQAVINHLLANLETKRLANKEKNQIGGKEDTIERAKARIVASNCQGQTSPVV